VRIIYRHPVWFGFIAMIIQRIIRGYLPAGEKANEFQSQVTLLKTEIKHPDQPLEEPFFFTITAVVQYKQHPSWTS
jgi:hypothetical protein